MFPSCPGRHGRLAVVALAMTVLAACDHSDPFTAPETRVDTPRVPGSIAQLTYSLLPDRSPVASPAAGAVLYQFETGDADRDICLAALPFTGGTRLREWCATDGQEATRADFFAVGALAEDGTLAYTQHSSLVFAPIPNAGALYVAANGDPSRREKVADLLRLYPGMPSPVDFLLGLTWTAADELTALATTANIARACTSCPWDTTYVGLAVVRIRTTETNQLEVVTLVPGASQLVFDPTLRRFAFLRDGDVWTLPATGGAPTLAYDWNADPGGREVVGLAAGGGELFVTRSWFENEVFRSDIARIVGTTAIAVAETQTTQGTWQRAAASSDGRRLVLERRARVGGSIDLYLVGVEP
jgi:hypothetical protein